MTSMQIIYTVIILIHQQNKEQSTEHDDNQEHLSGLWWRFLNTAADLIDMSQFWYEMILPVRWFVI